MNESRLARYVIGVAAGKGGVGKSSLSVNLALSLKKKGNLVGILDADIYGPSLQQMLSPEILPTHSSVDETRIQPGLSHGIKILSPSFFFAPDQVAIVRAPIANGLIKQFLHQVDWAPLDFLIIDFPPGTGDIQLTLMQEGFLSAGIIVTTPQEVALSDVIKAIRMFDEMNIPIVGIVENMSFFEDPNAHQKYYPFGNGGGGRLASKQGIPFLGEIPIDPLISSCCDEGKSIFDLAPQSRSCQMFDHISQQMIEQLEAFEHLEGSYMKNFELVWKEL